jgi:CBS domain-containing protein
METESSDAKSEFLMAIVGPLTSVAIGLFFLGLASMTGWSPELGTPSSPLWASFVWLGYINIFLAVFNMIPGYPLDGGRVLRSIIWRINGNMMRSMRIAARAGQFIAVAFIVIGIFRAFTGAGIGGLWLALLGWFLSEAATASYGEVQTSVAVAGVQARDVMSKTFPAIDGNLSLRTLAEEFLMQGERYFIVLEGGRASGLVTVQELKQIQRERWPFVPISRIAVPLERMRTISPESNIAEALRIMVQENLHELPVISNGELAGVINRSHMLQFLQMRADLKAA